MTSVYAFTPSTLSVFQFQPTLDGQVYNVTVTWNLTGQRWYLNIFDLSNTLIVSKALTGSPTALAVQSLSWSNGLVTATTAAPHGYMIGSTIDLTVSGCAPAAYNGIIQALITSPTTLQYPLAQNPGGATQLGAVSYDINLVAGYFETSTLVFREASQQFEVMP